MFATTITVQTIILLVLIYYGRKADDNHQKSTIITEDIEKNILELGSELISLDSKLRHYH